MDCFACADELIPLIIDCLGSNDIQNCVEYLLGPEDECSPCVCDVMVQFIGIPCSK